MSLRIAFRAFGTVAIHLFDSLLLAVFALWRSGPRQPLVLLVRVDHIGDFILWLPSALRLAGDYRRRGYRVVVVVSADCADLARRVEAFDAVLELDRAAFRLNPLYRTALLWKIWRQGAEEALHPTFSRVPTLGDAIIRASGAARRVGWSGDIGNATRFERRLGSSAYTTLFANPPDERAELRLNEGFLVRLGLPLLPFTQLPLPRRPVEGVSLPSRYAVLFPSARGELRRWPERRFADLATLLHRETGVVCVLCGGAGDRPTAQRILTESGVPMIDLTGRTTLDQLAEVIAGSAVVVSNETSAVHLAAVLAVACVSITGGGHFGRFVPYPAARLLDYAAPRIAVHPMPCFGCNWACRYPRPQGCAPCVEAVTVEQVAAEAIAVLRVIPVTVP